jgi:8-oxo-dGTP pyrophosphatase MutT (NUDIX family)
MSKRIGSSCRTANGACSWGLGRAQGSCAQQPAMVVRALAHRGASVLMLRRASGDSLGGCWELPGGKVDELDDGAEHPLEALAREFDEECGLKFRGTPRLIASAPRVTPKGKLVQELTYLAEVADGAERLSQEHDEARWHPLQEPAPGQLTEAAADGLALLRAGPAV